MVAPLVLLGPHEWVSARPSRGSKMGDPAATPGELASPPRPHRSPSDARGCSLGLTRSQSVDQEEPIVVLDDAVAVDL